VEEKDFVHLLVEIRDLQREHFEEYRRVTRESLELQRRAMEQGEQLRRLYLRVVTTGVLIVVAGVTLLIWYHGGFR
jgi:hypothetical protein